MLEKSHRNLFHIFLDNKNRCLVIPKDYSSGIDPFNPQAPDHVHSFFYVPKDLLDHPEEIENFQKNRDVDAINNVIAKVLGI